MHLPKQRYQVTAIKNRKIKTISGYITAPDGYVAYRCIQVAETARHAIAQAKNYHIPPGTKYDSIRAVPIDELEDD